MILSVQTEGSLCNTKSSGTLFIFWGGMRSGMLIQTILCVRTDFPADVLVFCVYSAPACALWCCPDTAEFHISFSGMRLVHLTPSSRSPANCNSVVTEVTQSFPEDKLCKAAIQPGRTALWAACSRAAVFLPCSPPGTCTACYLTDLCSGVARPGVVSAEKNLKHKVLLRSSRRALQTVTSFFFFFLMWAFCWSFWPVEKRSFCRNLFLVTSLDLNVFFCLTLCLYCLFSRSLCTVVCKWTYTSDRGWDDSFWKMIGLEDLVKDKYEKIGISGLGFNMHIYSY